jgi:hypothetical protein
MPAPSDAGAQQDATPAGQLAAAALTDLAARFDPSDFITVLTTGQGRTPCLTVTTRHAARTEDIYAQDGWYWHARAERITPTTNAHGAAATIARCLGRATRPHRPWVEPE